MTNQQPIVWVREPGPDVKFLRATQVRSCRLPMRFLEKDKTRPIYAYRRASKDDAGINQFYRMGTVWYRDELNDAAYEGGMPNEAVSVDALKAGG